MLCQFRFWRADRVPRTSHPPTHGARSDSCSAALRLRIMYRAAGRLLQTGVPPGKAAAGRIARQDCPAPQEPSGFRTHARGLSRLGFWRAEFNPSRGRSTAAAFHHSLYCSVAVPLPITPGSVNTNCSDCCGAPPLPGVLTHWADSFTSTKPMFRVAPVLVSMSVAVPVQSTLMV